MNWLPHASLPTKGFSTRLKGVYQQCPKGWRAAPLSDCCELIDLDRPEFAWLTLLLDMCNAVAANQPGLVSISVAQARDFFSIAEEIDDKWVSH